MEVCEGARKPWNFETNVGFPMPGLQGNFAEFGVGLGGSSLFFGQMAARWGRKMLAVATWMPRWEGDHPHATLHIHAPRSK